MYRLSLLTGNFEKINICQEKKNQINSKNGKAFSSSPKNKIVSTFLKVCIRSLFYKLFEYSTLDKLRRFTRKEEILLVAVIHLLYYSCCNTMNTWQSFSV